MSWPSVGDLTVSLVLDSFVPSALAGIKPKHNVRSLSNAGQYSENDCESIPLTRSQSLSIGCMLAHISDAKRKLHRSNTTQDNGVLANIATDKDKLATPKNFWSRNCGHVQRTHVVMPVVTVVAEAMVKFMFMVMLTFTLNVVI